MRFLLLLAALTLSAQRPADVYARSLITIVDRNGKNERVVYTSGKVFEAPNWTPDGKWLIVNSEGKLYRLPVAGGEPELIPTGAVQNLNNDHGVSPDGKLLVISAGPMYRLPFDGGEPERITEKTPSYYHGWSPDGRTLAYCAQREGNFDVYTIPLTGGTETRLTTAAGYDDGPDYSRDGRWIYFNSDRAGQWDIWRMPASGAGEGDKLAEKIIDDGREEWFAHPSPDGRWLVYLSFPVGTKGHPAGRTVQLRRVSTKPGARSTLLKEFFGGQGTINVNSWSPDSKHFAFVRYEPK